MNPEQAFQRMVDAGGFDGLVSYPPSVVIMPFPVSIHEVYRKHNGRNLSERYKAWRDEAGWLLIGQKPRKLSGAVDVVVDLVAPDKRQRDADNYLKAPLDLLVAHHIIEGDSSRFVRSCTARWVTSGPPCTVTITRSEEQT